MKVGAIVVAYNPDDGFTERVNNISIYANNVVVVDNTFGYTPIKFNNDKVDYIRLYQNKGIARALNIGVNRAFTLGCNVVFLFDQDSEPSANVFNVMLSTYQSAIDSDEKCVLGTAYFDTRMEKVAPFISFKGLHLVRTSPEGKESLIAADYIITSGSLFSKQVWELVGEFDDSLFIDYVDIEWCLRGKAKGIQIYGEPRCIMTHTLGDEPIRLLGRKLPVHSPVRHYYFFRNCISLLRRDYISSGFKVREFCFLPIRFLVYSLFTKNKLSHITKMSKGLLDGVLSKSGPYR